MNAAALMLAGQAFHASQFPATVTILEQAYAASRSPLIRLRDLIGGGWLNKFKVSFWVPVQAFGDAGQPIPVAGDYVTWQGRDFVAYDVSQDPSGQTMVLRCQSPDQ